MKREVSFFVIVLTLAVGSSACRDRYFSDRNAAVKYFTEHHDDFERAAEAWASGVPAHPSVFCAFGPDSFRWGGAFIRKVSDGFAVEGGGRKAKLATLDEAIQAIGAPPKAFAHWSEVATQNKMYCIEDGSDATVEIMLVGSDWSPYGFRYAPRNNQHGLDTLTFYARQGGMDNTDRRMEPVSGRWFYFEAKR
jgi:hypothetical protein